MENNILPMLALRGKLVFPETSTFFEVSRTRSLKALEEAINHNQMLFLVTQKDPSVENPSEEDLYTVGTVGRIQQMVRAGQLLQMETRLLLIICRELMLPMRSRH